MLFDNTMNRQRQGLASMRNGMPQKQGVMQNQYQMSGAGNNTPYNQSGWDYTPQQPPMQYDPGVGAVNGTDWLRMREMHTPSPYSSPLTGTPRDYTANARSRGINPRMMQRMMRNPRIRELMKRRMQRRRPMGLDRMGMF